jgi:hypothetical protein
MAKLIALPDPETIKSRLGAATREAEILRQLLRVSERAKERRERAARREQQQKVVGNE